MPLTRLKRLTMFNHHPNWCFFSVQSIFPAFLFHSSNPNSEGFFLKSHLDPVHVRSTITDPASQLRMPLTLPADWELQSPLLTYIVTEHSHWSHRSSSTSHWLSKIAPARLIGRKTELQLCKNSISAAGTTWWCLGCVTSAQGFPAKDSSFQASMQEPRSSWVARWKEVCSRGPRPPRTWYISPNCYITLYNSPFLLPNTSVFSSAEQKVRTKLATGQFKSFD